MAGAGVGMINTDLPDRARVLNFHIGGRDPLLLSHKERLDSPAFIGRRHNVGNFRSRHVLVFVVLFFAH